MCGPSGINLENVTLAKLIFCQKESQLPIFYYHTMNKVARDLAALTNTRGFLYSNRGELELKIQRQVAELGYDMWPTYHTVLGAMDGQLHKFFQFNPDDPLDNYAIKLIKKDTAWCYVKIVNGKAVQGVVGYCSSGTANPYGLSEIQKAQAGITPVGFVPRMM
jgi:hypothetical protein